MWNVGSEVISDLIIIIARKIQSLLPNVLKLRLRLEGK